MTQETTRNKRTATDFATVLLITETKKNNTEVVKDYLSRVPSLQPFVTLQNPDILILNPDDEALSIEMVRRLITESAYKPLTHECRVVVVYNLETASIPAQNALLKLLEEPPEYLRILLTTTRPQSLLPTIISRCQTIKMHQETKTEISNEVSTIYQNIISQPLGTVMELVTPYKDKSAAEEILEELLVYVHQNRHPSATSTLQLKQLLLSVSMIRQNANVTLVLEHCFIKLKQFQQAEIA